MEASVGYGFLPFFLQLSDAQKNGQDNCPKLMGSENVGNCDLGVANERVLGS